MARLLFLVPILIVSSSLSTAGAEKSQLCCLRPYTGAVENTFNSDEELMAHGQQLVYVFLAQRLHNQVSLALSKPN